MNRLRTVRNYVAASVVLPAAAVLIWSEQLWLHALFIVWLLAAAALWIMADRKAKKAEAEQAMQALRLQSIRTLNHHRHDWMNDLQILYGYIKMNKQDKAIQCVENIKVKTEKERALAGLGILSFVQFLQSFRTTTTELELDVAVEGAVNLAELQLNGQQVGDALADLIMIYKYAIRPGGSGEPARLSLLLARDEKRLYATMRFDGELAAASEVGAKIKQRIKGTPLKLAESQEDWKLAKLQAELA